jgi:glycosyltransferase involved in cell wall biosynthesis
VSIVVPVRNEAGNVVPLLDEIERACATFGSFEVVYVDDGSADATAAELAQARATRPWLRVIRHAESCGQSAAVRTGVCAARASIVATLDGDGQNDPAFIPELVSAVLKDGTRDTGCGLKAFRRETYLALPYFDALHRFMPALVKREGLGVAHVDVVDRPRLAGQSNYGMFDRLWVGILDLAGVWWLIRRRRRVARSEELS